MKKNLSRNLPLNQLHNVLNHFAPDSLVQLAIYEIRIDMETAGESDTKIVLAFADLLTDGLRHGNWPGKNPKGDLK